jgi:hypothetical protein
VPDDAEAGRASKSLREVFRPLIAKVIKQYIADRIADRLQNGLNQEVAARPVDPTLEEATVSEVEVEADAAAPAS